MPRGLRAPTRPLADDAIRLEPLDDRYVPDFRRLLEDPEVVRNTRVPSSPPPDFASMWIGRYVDGWRDGSRAGFAILSPEAAFLGFGGVVDLDLDAWQGEIGYVVAPEARGRGVAGRALRLITTWALDELGLERVELHIDREKHRLDPRRRTLCLRPRGRSALAPLQGGHPRGHSDLFAAGCRPAVAAVPAPPVSRPKNHTPAQGGGLPLSPAGETTGSTLTPLCRIRVDFCLRGARLVPRLALRHARGTGATARPAARGDRDPARLGP